MKAVAGAAVGLIVGFALHAVLFATPTAKIASIAATAALAARSTAIQERPQCVTDWPRMRNEVASAVHEALEQDAPNVAPTAPAVGERSEPEPSAPAQPARPLTEEQEQAREAKAELVDRALDRGVWTEADATAARRLLPGLTHDDQRDLMSRVAVAINSGKLKVEARRPF